MTGRVRVSDKWWGRALLEIVACAVCVSIALLAPAREADDWLTGKVLRKVAPTDSASSVIAVSVGGDLVRSGDCPDSLSRVLREGEAKTALVLPSAEALCPVAASEPGPPRVLLPREALRVRGGEVVGFMPSELPAPAHAALGSDNADWVAPRSWRAVAAVSLSDLASRRVDPSALSERVVVVGVDDALATSPEADGPWVSRVAGAAAAAIEDRPRQAMPTWMAGLLAAVLAMLLAVGSRLRGRYRARVASLGLAFVMLVVSLIGGALGYGWLVPHASMAAALSGFLLVMHVPGAIASIRGRNEALKLLEQVADMASEDVKSLSDQEFWARLARRVADAHPADNVLLAELPAHSWRLKIHANDEVSEVVVRERRRDVRRTPFTDIESGQRRIKVVSRFVVMKDVPTVLVPLEASGATEAYLFLIGNLAVDAFQREPGDTERLASDLAKLIRKRRLARTHADDWRRPAGVLVANPSDKVRRIVEGTRAAVGKLDQLARIAEASPVGLLYADAFGDVRMVGESVSRWLTRLGVDVPVADKGHLLPPGGLPLSRVLAAIAKEAKTSPLSPDELSDEERSFEVSGAAVGGPAMNLVFKIRRLAADDAPYFVGALVEIPRRTVGEQSNVETLPEAGDPLAVFSLAQLLVDVVDATARRGEGRIRLQTPRIMAQVLGHRRELRDALSRFLGEVASRSSGSSTPTLTVSEHEHRVELTILDLQLGVPPAAVKRTLMAPSMPPPGMVSLGGLARAIEHSHGTVNMMEEKGWGIQISANLVRARPRIEMEPMAEVVELPRAPKVPKG